VQGRAGARLASDLGKKKVVMITLKNDFGQEVSDQDLHDIAFNLTGFYDGLIFHRVIADFVIQGGDPNGDGTGGSGTTVAWEDTGLKNLLHTIAMARSNPDDATSQFFINLKDNANLDTAPAYVVFGRVVGGHEVVTAIGSVPTDANDKPLSPVTMTRVYMES